jgi:hypothetical protein
MDRSRFRVHLYQRKPGELHAFLQEADSRLPIVLVTSVQDLSRIKDLDDVHSFVLFEDPDVLNRVQGIRLLDAEPDEAFGSFKKVKITPERLNAALLMGGEFKIPEDVLESVRSLSKDISFRELLQSVVAGRSLTADFTKHVCMYLVGLLQKKSWVARVQKVGLTAGVAVEKMAELEKFIETSPPAEMLWRAYYEHAEAGVPVKSACDQFEADEKDVEFLVSVLGAEKGQRYYRNPHETPLIFKKKRSKKPKKLPQVESPSMSVSPIDDDRLHEEMAQMSPSTGFDIVASLRRIDDATKSFDFSRVACSFLCGLVDASEFSSAKKRAVDDGASKEDVVAVSKYIKNDPEAQAIKQAYAYFAWTIDASAPASAQKYGANFAKFNAILRYKPMAFVFRAPGWPGSVKE